MRLYEFIIQGTLDHDSMLICADTLEEALTYYPHEDFYLKALFDHDGYNILHFRITDTRFAGGFHVAVYSYEIKRGQLL